MTLEVWATLASVGTFIVFAATAVAAVIQLRHMRAGNQIAAVMQLNSVFESPEFERARRFIREELDVRLRDAEFRKQLTSIPLGEAARPLLVVGNCYEQLGMFVKRGIIDETMASDLWSAQAVGDWALMAPAIAVVRRRHGQSTWENFEYFVDAGERWISRYPNGTYPTNRPRKKLEDFWLAEDQAAPAD